MKRPSEASLRNIIIFGNSGSGKSTLAAELCKAHDLSHLDLDNLAWLPSTPPARRALSDSKQEIQRFIEQADGWVIEGCYADLLELIEPFATEAIFMNLPLALCQQNARNRPWEPHKYESKEAQDNNLAMLLDWIAQYYARDDMFSYQSHRNLFDRFHGLKKEIVNNTYSR